MAKERSNKELKKEESVSDAGYFLKLPSDIQTVLLNKFHTIHLLTLRTNRFLYKLIHDFILFWESPKFTLANIFRPKTEKAKAAKKGFSDLIVGSNQRISLTGVKLKGIASEDLPPNLDLKGADCLEAPFCPVKKTNLLNRIEMAEIGIGISSIKLATIQYDQFGKDLGVKTQNFDFVEHFILYHFSEFPIHPELKKKLDFKHQYHLTSKSENTLPINLQPFFPVNNSPGFQIYNELPLWVSCPKECSNEEKEAFRAWIKTISQSIIIDSNSVIFFDTDTTEEGVERCMFVLNGKYAYDLLRNNLFRTALKLHHEVPWFLYDDTKETCQLLIGEIEKFRGFAHGVPDEKIDDIKEILNDIHGCADEVKKKFKQIEKWVEENKKNGPINLSLLEKQIDERNLAIYKPQLLRHFLHLNGLNKIIEEALITNTDNKPHCLVVLQNELTKSYLPSQKIIELFEAFKDIEIFNRHRNPNLDEFFGIKNTESFKKAWKVIRDNAKAKLFSEVDKLKTNEEKKKVLMAARNHSFFKEHRNNFFFEGAFGRTQAVIDIDKKLSMIP